MKTSMSLTNTFRKLRPQPKVSFSLSWLLILPAGLWAVAALYIPILAAALSPLQTGLATALIALLVVASILGHAWAHVLAARLVGSGLPEHLSLYVFGDAAQAWSAADTAEEEALVALAGPAANGLMAAIAYSVWNAQVSAILNVSMPFWALYNIWLIVINLAPAFPLDGGRLMHAVTWSLTGRADWPRRAMTWAGYGLIAALGGWSVFLLVQQSRYSLATAGFTLACALVFLLGLLKVPARNWPQDANPPEQIRGFPLRVALSVLVFIALLGVASASVLTNNGLEAPGVAISVEPMVDLPAQYVHQPGGTFILTAVIQQSPIPAGAWYAAQWMHSIAILPPEKKAPNQPSAQETARQDFQMLDQSETTALVVGLRLAGYPAEEIGKGAQVVEILDGSPAKGILQPGDLITAVNGVAVHSASDLVGQVQALDATNPVTLTITRDNASRQVGVALIPPAQPGDPPRLGISVQDGGYDFKLPFAAQIVPQKIVGGPSAGLMFTLTVDNLLTPGDLTHGYKIAGTGTINPDGSVGPIGGVKQKVAAAEIAGARYFFAPADNYADAVSVAHNIQVVKVESVDQALQFLAGLPPHG